MKTIKNKRIAKIQNIYEKKQNIDVKAKEQNRTLTIDEIKNQIDYNDTIIKEMSFMIMDLNEKVKNIKKDEKVETDINKQIKALQKKRKK